MKNPLYVSIATISLLLMSFSEWGSGLFGYIALVPLILFWEHSRDCRSVVLWSWIIGFVFYLISLYWLSRVTVPGLILLALLEGAYLAIAGYLYQKIKRENVYVVLFLAPCLWTALEYIRGFGAYGFPWLYLGFSQHQYPEMVQIASIGGIFFLSFFVFMMNFSFSQLIRSELGISRRLIVFLIPLALCAFVWIFGSLRIDKHHVQMMNKNLKTLRIGVIQPNIPQSEKWDPLLAEDHLDTLIMLSRKAAKQNPSIIVWPESSLPGYIKSNRSLYRAIALLAQETGVFLLIGGDDQQREEPHQFYNSAFLVSPDGRIIDQYNKMHLVPYGEYAPFRSLFPFIARWALGELEFSPGKEKVIFQMGQINIAALICFEDIFPALMRSFKNKGAGLIVNITNDAWYGRSRAARLHVQHAALCAVANGIGIVQSANTGVSCVISPLGEVLRKIVKPSGDDIFIEGYGVWDVPLINVETFYSKYGDFFSIVCIVVSFICIILFVLRDKMRAKLET